MDTPLARLMVKLKDTVPQFKWLWLWIWKAEIARENRRYLRQCQ